MGKPLSLKLDGKVAMVTGGARGIGRAIARALASAGANVAIVDMEAADAAETADMVRNEGRQALTLSADVSRRDEVFQAVEDIITQMDRIDIAVNNAGILTNHNALELTEEEWRRVLGVNLDGVLWCCQAVAERMIAQGRGGRIINIGSVSGRFADWPRKHVAYSVSKAGVVMLTRYLAVEWGPHGITVNSISPSNTETEMLDVEEDVRRRWRDMSPLGRLAKPEEIGAAAVFLASEGGSYVSGHDLVVDAAATCL
jgi:NAD(P)-dependent dehydrogenase (short-subunit alcohol dehydrogenase family)